MKRHSDPKALLRDRGNSSFKWGSRVGDRPPRHASKITSDPETPFGKESPSIKSASENEEEKTIRTLLEGDGGAGTDVLGGKFVPLGEHHDGSFGVYMAHKISKLRQQTNGAVGRLEGMRLNLIIFQCYSRYALEIDHDRAPGLLIVFHMQRFKEQTTVPRCLIMTTSMYSII